jgi:hypothetical protein
MSATTGQVYLQVYDKNLNKFIEYPTGLAPLNLVIRPTGVNGVNVYPFSGLLSSLFGADKIFSYPSVNIGAANAIASKGLVIGEINFSLPDRSDSSDNINIGTFNLTSGSNLINLGKSNSSNDSASSINIGIGNILSKSSLIYNLGENNNLSGVYNAFNIGSNNTLVRSKNAEILNGADVWNIYNFGINNEFISGARKIISIGEENYIEKVRNGTLLGRSNYIYDSNIIGASNIILGDGNTSSSSSNYIVLGIGNSFQKSNDHIIIGMDNYNINENAIDGNLIFGSFNYNSGSNNALIGKSNTILGDNAFILGIGNTTLNNTNSDTIIGNTNSTSGTNNNYIFGDNNTLGLFESGTSDNFYIGQNNSSDSGNNNYVLGIYNKNSNTNNSYIVGQSNLTKNTNENYIFGTNNQASGQNTYIVGYDNIIRTGDYNSIIIGHGYQPTGENKDNSVILYSDYGSIEINPNGINLKSDLKPKFNNENFIFGEDFNGYAKETTVIPRSGFFNSTVFQDPEYNFIADEIQLNSFAYSGRGERYYSSSFTGVDYDKTIYTFQSYNYFNKIPSYLYTGAKNFIGPYYYQSNDNALLLAFNTTPELVPSRWTISKTEGDGIFYTNQTSYDYNSTPPLNGWIATGYRGLSGTDPVPTLNIVTEFTGKFNQKKLRYSLNSRAFNFNSSNCYSSDEISVIYGDHTDSRFDSTWLVVDNFSSGVYYINNNYTLNQTPQTGWLVTGFAGSSGSFVPPNLAKQEILIGPTGINLSMGTRVGVIFTNIDEVGGRVYVPYFY